MHTTKATHKLIILALLLPPFRVFGASPNGVLMDCPGPGCPSSTTTQLDCPGPGCPAGHDHAIYGIKPGPLTLPHQFVNFAIGSAKLSPEAMLKLDKVVKILRAMNHSPTVLIYGHTDGTGSMEYNRILSEQRAQSVRGYFIKEGLNLDSLKTKGYGEEKPVASNKTAAGRMTNRRVEFYLESDH